MTPKWISCVSVCCKRERQVQRDKRDRDRERHRQMDIHTHRKWLYCICSEKQWICFEEGSNMTKLKAIVFQMNQSHCFSPKKLPLIIILKHYLLRIYCCQYFTIVSHLFITTTILNILLCPFFRWGHWGSEKGHNLSIMAEQELKKRLQESKDCFIPPAVYTFYHMLLILSGKKKKKTPILTKSLGWEVPLLA